MRNSSLFDLLDGNEEAGVDFENAILDGASFACSRVNKAQCINFTGASLRNVRILDEHIPEPEICQNLVHCLLQALPTENLTLQDKLARYQLLIKIPDRGEEARPLLKELVKQPLPDDMADQCINSCLVLQMHSEAAQLIKTELAKDIASSRRLQSY